jgi:xanthine/uracil permease
VAPLDVGNGARGSRQNLGFSPKFGALILSIPGPVIGGLSIVLFGLIAAMAGRIWVENKVDFRYYVASATTLSFAGAA